jgi:hypothetical protein
MLVCNALVYFNGDNSGETLMEQSVLLGFQFCVSPPRDPANGADVITTSLGIFDHYHPRYGNYRAMEQNIEAAGITHCVAAGNEGPSPHTIRCMGDCPPPWPNPANNPTDTASSAVITVGATDNSDNAASFTSIGPSIIWDSVAPYHDYVYPPGLMDPDVCAPGVNILSTFWEGDSAYTTMSGTSMATPATAGCVALMLSKNPYLTPRIVDSILECCAVKDLGPSGKDVTYGAGRINCSLAVAYTPFPGPNHNLALALMIAPQAKVDPAIALTPRVLLVNAGTYHEADIPLHMTIDSSGNPVYDQTVTVPSIDSAASDTVTFPDWTPGQGGNSYQVMAWHSYSPDTNRGNDTLHRQVRVKVHDVASIGTNLTGYVRSNTPVAPGLTLADSGDYTEYSVNALCWIDSAGTRVYNESVAVDSVVMGGTRQVTFPDWTPGPNAMTYNVTLFHALASDERKVNDTLHSTVATRGHDVAATQTNLNGRVKTGQPVTPRLTLTAPGDYTEYSFPATCRIDSAGTTVYNQTVTVDSVVFGDSTQVSFPDWTPGPESTFYNVTLFHSLASDGNHSNDTLYRTVMSSNVVMNVAIEIATGSNGRNPPNACYRIDSLCRAQGWDDSIVAGTDINSAAKLANFTVVVTGDAGYDDNDFLDYQSALLDWVRSGGGFVGLGWYAYGVYTKQAWLMDSAGAVMCSGSYGYVSSGSVNILDSTNSITQGVHNFPIQAYGEYAGSGTWPDATMLGDYTGASGYASIACRNVGSGHGVYLGPIYFGSFSAYQNEPYYDDADAMLLLKQALEWAAMGPSSGVRETGKLPARPSFGLRGIAPNPTDGKAAIRYSLASSAIVKLAVYDLTGRDVATLVSGRQPAGNYSVSWSRLGRDAQRIPSGVYFVRFDAASCHATRKLVVE